ncbi:MAG: hypothetical protein L0L95_13020, partial [Staphylococcus equorum]|nr:hypothetical protein [Staphylococcus equorum]
VENMNNAAFYVKIKGLSKDYFYQVSYNRTEDTLKKYTPSFEYATKEEVAKADKNNDDYNTIWTGSMVMNETDEVITLKPLTECENGWILVFKEPSGASGNVNYCYVPKVQPDLYASYGINFVVGVRSGGVRAKFLYINDLTITGHSSNATGGNEDTELVRVISY